MRIFPSRLFTLGATAAGASFLLTGPVLAQTPTFTFAQYVQQTSAQAFTLTNNGPASTITANDQVYFKFQPNANYPQTSGLPGNFFDTTMTFTATNPIGPATGSNTTGTQITETFNNYSFSFIDNASKKNLLSGSGNNLILAGKYNEGSATLQVSTPPAGDVVFTSDYINFATSTDRNFAISLSSVVPVLAIDPNNYVRSFTAASSGTFASNFNNPAPVPEPGMVTFALTSGAGMVGMVLRGRHRISRRQKSA